VCVRYERYLNRASQLIELVGQISNEPLSVRNKHAIIWHKAYLTEFSTAVSLSGYKLQSSDNVMQSCPDDMFLTLLRVTTPRVPILRVPIHRIPIRRIINLRVPILRVPILRFPIRRITILRRVPIPRVPILIIGLTLS
jgi:hypothetical protein